MRSVITSISAAALLLYVAALGVVLTEYDPTLAVEVVGRVTSWMHERGLSETLVTPERVEFGLNALMFSPLAFLASVVLPRHPWANWVVYGFVASGAVELFQGLYLAPRSAQMADVVANSLGALLGAIAALPVVVTWPARGSGDNV